MFSHKSEPCVFVIIHYILVKGFTLSTNCSILDNFSVDFDFVTNLDKPVEKLKISCFSLVGETLDVDDYRAYRSAFRSDTNKKYYHLNFIFPQ